MQEVAKAFQGIFKNISLAKIIICIVIIIVAIVLVFVAGKAKKKIQALNEKRKSNAVDKATLRITFDIIKAAIVVLTVLAILQLFGVNVSSLIAGLGIASAIIGLALQDALKDIVFGMHILNDNFYKVGTAVKYGDFEGVIDSFSLRTTKIYDFDKHRLLIVSNRNISDITVIPNPMRIDLQIGLSHDEDPEKVHKDLEEIAKIVEQEDCIKECVYKGTDQFCASCIEYRISIFVTPYGSNVSRRQANMVIQRELGKRGYKLPFDQLDIHNK